MQTFGEEWGTKAPLGSLDPFGYALGYTLVILLVILLDPDFVCALGRCATDVVAPVKILTNSLNSHKECSKIINNQHNHMNYSKIIIKST